MFYLESSYATEMIAHAREEAQNECCGVLAGSNGRVKRLFRAANALKSPVRYSVDPRDLLLIHRELDAHGWDVVGVYHSHTHSPAYPSATDIELAFWPDSLYVIISLMEPERPVIRAFRIGEGRVEEEEIRLVER